MKIIKFNIDFEIEILNCRIETIIACFKKLSNLILAELAMKILLEFAIQYMEEKKQPFVCNGCGDKSNFIWKTKQGKPSKISTIFGAMIVGQMQVQCKSCSKKKNITRELLGIEPRKQMSEGTKKMFALLGGLTSFRVSEKILKLVGVQMDKMKVWRCTQEVGEKLEFDLDPNEKARGEADGTGVAIKGIKKRGKELKVFVQEKVSGGVRIAGLSIGNYEGEWNKLFKPLKRSMMSFESFLLVTDGDTSILKGLKGVKLIFQRCLWHIPYQMRYYLWKDGVKRKSEEWYKVQGKIFDIASTRNALEDDKEVEAIVKTKEEHLDALILHCTEKGYTCCSSYLKNARDDMFTALSKRLAGHTTSKVERVMKTVNMRIKMGKWSPTGALNVIKVRLAHYYNGFDPSEEMENNEIQVFKVL